MVHEPPDLTRGGVYRFARAGCYLDRFRYLSWLERNIHGKARVRDYRDARLRGFLETALFGFHAVVADGQVSHCVKAVAVCSGRAYEISRQIGDGDHRIGNCRSVGVFHRAGDAAKDGLPLHPESTRGKQHNQRTDYYQSQSPRLICPLHFC